MAMPQTIQRMMQGMKAANDPMGYLRQQCTNNPYFSRAIQITQGKDEGQIKQIIRNLAEQNGMNDQQLNQFLGNFGLHL